jgi:hypothetical protein
MVYPYLLRDYLEVLSNPSCKSNPELPQKIGMEQDSSDARSQKISKYLA